ncbi:MAG: hydroxyethylthiazole kinase [Raoultibacter sp.]|jgi:hydroxyethylthiazole kinase
MDTKTLGEILEKVRAGTPLVHNITNYVTVNDCANAILAVGASPIMSDEPEDVEDITSICGALNINIGTLNQSSIEAMLRAGKKAGSLGHPIVLDPVGAGASKLRTETAGNLLDTLAVSVIRGNMSEAKALAGGAASTRGVDVCPADLVSEENLAESADFACKLAQSSNTLVAITGPIDIIADAHCAYAIRNGSPLQERMTGAGCMLSGMCAAFAVAHPENILEAILASVVVMGLAGQIAEERMTEQDGNGSYRTYLLDALYTMDTDTFAKRARVERRL